MSFHFEMLDVLFKSVKFQKILLLGSFTKAGRMSYVDFDILLTVHLNIFVLILTNLMH